MNNPMWKEYSIGDIGTVIGGGTPSTKNEKYYEGDISWITPKDLSNFHERFIFRGERSISMDGYNNSSAQMLPPGSVLFSSRAPIGYIAIAGKELCTNQGFKSVIPNDKICDSMFLYYLLSYYRHDIEAIASGTTFMEVSGTAMKKFMVKIPALPIQQDIAAILSSLDAKIELNTQINHNLEEQAKAIFKSWFVDSVNAESSHKLPLEAIITNTIGGDWGNDCSSGKNTEETFCIRGADIPDVRIGNKGKMPIRYILPNNFLKKHLVDGDLVVEISGGSPTQSTGRCAVISDAMLKRYENKVICTNFCKALKPVAGYSHFLFHLWTYLYEQNVFFGYENGTTGIKNLNITGVLTNEEFADPPKDMLEKFNLLCSNISSTIFANGLEIERLSMLRDTLLPKLMSGEIDVSEVEI